MAHCLIYVPQTHYPPRGERTAETILTYAGLPDFVADHAAAEVETGPDGGAGVLFAWDHFGRSNLAFDAARQAWRRASLDKQLPVGRYWVGAWNESPPTFEEHARPYQFAGREVLAFDGMTQAVIPTPVTLGMEATLADDGTWRFTLQRRFHAYGVEVLRRRQRLLDGSISSSTMLDLIRFAAASLRLNYRLPQEALGLMGTFTEEDARNIFFAAVEP